MDSPAPAMPSPLNTPTAATAINIFVAALVIAGVMLILSLLVPFPSTESAREVVQMVPISGAKPYGTRGLMVPLPPPSEEVSGLVTDGWTLDLPDNNDHPVQCRHKRSPTTPHIPPPANWQGETRPRGEKRFAML